MIVTPRQRKQILLNTALCAGLAKICLGQESASGQTPARNLAPDASVGTGSNAPTVLPDVVVTGRQDSMLGIADSAGQGATGAAQLAERPILRSGEILEIARPVACNFVA